MKSFEIATFFRKNKRNSFLKALKTSNKKQLATVGFLVLLICFYVSGPILRLSDNTLENTSITIERYGAALKANLNEVIADTIVHDKEREQLLLNIEEKLVGYLYQIPDYSYFTVLEPYLEYAPTILEQIPSAVPLERGDYWLSSEYGIRQHPLSYKKKKHFGIDLAANLDKHVYASAKGTVMSVLHSKNGYGTHIIIKHRFGFQTLYGHLNKVLVKEGQAITQHELIGTVGNTGSSTGYHLHYEIIKNGLKIDPLYSLRLKQKIYERLYEKTKRYGTQEKRHP